MLLEAANIAAIIVAPALVPILNELRDDVRELALSAEAP